MESLPGSQGTLGTNVLADRLRVIPTNPQWASVEDAGRTLRLGVTTDTAQLQRDIALVADFYKLLVRCKNDIARAIACGAAIGSALPEGTSHERVTLGLDILSQALRLRTKTDASPALKQTIAELEVALSKGSPSMIESLRNAAASDMALIDTARLPDLRVALSSFISVKEALNLDDAKSWQVVLNSAWNSAKQRVLAELTRKSPFPDAHINEMFCQARGQGPGPIISFSFLQMSAAQFTNALFLAIKRPQQLVDVAADEVPPWVALAAMHALGFGRSEGSDIVALASALTQGATQDQLRELLEYASQGVLLARRPASDTVIAIRRKESSLLASWAVHPEHLLVAGTRAEIEAVMRLPLHRFIGPGPIVLAIEAEPDVDADETERMAREAVGDLARLQSVAVIHVYAEGRPSGKVPALAVFAPKDVVDIVRAARKSAA